ncbi:MAG: hypothetical protein A2940_01185 [Candidatus Wildermuthbacteria bacterium RIFCSPLOWO2_01_FULL_48_29]|uniref:Uncharacterized protein n=1 Tax=Candidatus Wildermuthbacteria bacterium RIFCSPLOWO2_01_FULL_48_29 TaxID=1802462 RepID=A0A1G2RM14_9BACT|nr:MAG: hypothetical protein A2940_01185 [Candidatus Wildermuthbacteria bacterium RIFCSPLOWO2_01_FULL_48_29]
MKEHCDKLGVKPFEIPCSILKEIPKSSPEAEKVVRLNCLGTLPSFSLLRGSSGAIYLIAPGGDLGPGAA